MPSKREDGTWRVSLRLGTKRVSKSFPTKALAVEYEAKVRLAKVAPTAPQSKLTFGEYADTWLKAYSEVEKAPSSQIEDEYVVRIYVKPLLGSHRLSALTAADLDGFKITLKQRIDDGKLSAKTANNVLAITKKIMRCAVARNLRSAYPWDAVSNFKLVERDFKYWNEVDGKRFYEAARFRNKEMADMVLLAMNTGLRLGEIRGLKWDAIDLKRGIITVRATYNEKLKAHLARTKNRRIGRVRINAAVRSLLESRKALSFGGLVFDPKKIMQPNNVFRRLQISLKVAPLIRFHDLRHSYASNLIAAGEDIYSVQKLMRHSTLAMTERYAHHSEDHLASAANSIGTGMVPRTEDGSGNTEKHRGNMEPPAGVEPAIQYFRVSDF